MAFHRAAAQTVLFGGTDGNLQLNDTWVWNGVSWSQRTPVASPPGRGGHAMAYDPRRQRVVLHGGRAATILNDTWEWDGTSWQAFTGTAPIAGPTVGMAWDPACQALVLIVRPSSGPSLQAWSFDGSTWTLRMNVGAPAAISDFSVAHDPVQGRVITYGGQNSSSTERYDCAAGSWLNSCNACPPGVLGNAGMTTDTDRQRVILVGGYTPTGAASATWFYSSNGWQPYAGPTQISSRGEPAIAYDSCRRRVVVFGGVRGTTTLGDTWELTELPQAAPFCSGCPGSNGTPSLSLASNAAWIGTTMSLQLSNAPLAAFQPVFLYLGGSRTTWGPLPLPFPLSGFGAPGCLLCVALDVPFVTLTNLGGVATWPLLLPNDGGLVGAELYFQALPVDLLANALGLSASNGLAVTPR